MHLDMPVCESPHLLLCIVRYKKIGKEMRCREIQNLSSGCCFICSTVAAPELTAASDADYTSAAFAALLLRLWPWSLYLPLPLPLLQSQLLPCWGGKCFFTTSISFYFTN